MKQRKGFTLLEMIVVVGMIAVLLTILVPNMKGFTQMGSTGVTDSNIITLNLATKSYATFKEIMNQDIFEGVNTDSDRMKVLVDEVLLDKEVSSLDKEKTYCWNITDQTWIVSSTSAREGCGGSFTPAPPAEIYTPAPYPTLEPTNHPDALPTNKPLETEEQTKCLVSRGKYDPVNKLCLCPAGFVLNKEEGICITSEEYLCINSGGSYDRDNKACACPIDRDLILNDDQSMCIKIVIPKDCPTGTRLNPTTNQCEKRFDYDSANPNYIIAENRINPKKLNDILTYEEYQAKAKETASDLLYLNMGDYFIYRNEIFYVRAQVPIQSTVSFDAFMSAHRLSVFNLPDASRVAQYNMTAYQRELILQDGIWYEATNDNISTKPGSDSNWKACGATVDEISKKGVCSLSGK